MTIAKTSTSYPVLSVIQEFSLTGDAERIVWKIAEHTVKIMQGTASQDSFIILHRRLKLILGDTKTMRICMNLQERLTKAHESYAERGTIPDINLSTI